MEDISNNSVYTNTESSPKKEEIKKKSFLNIFKSIKWKKVVLYFFLLLIVSGIGYIGYRFYMFKPYRVFVTNVSSRSATISWITEDPEPGIVLYTEGNSVLPIWISQYGMDGVGYDDRDYSDAELAAAEQTQENISESGEITSDQIETEIVVTEYGSYWNHHVTLRNLTPESSYSFWVGNGLVFEKVEAIDSNTASVTTLEEQDDISTPVPAYGLIKYYDGDYYIVPQGTTVYCYLSEEFTGIESETISSVLSDSGGWYLDLSNAFTSEGESFFDLLEGNEAANITLHLTIENEWFGRWTKDMDYVDSAPAEEIILYNTDDFTSDDEDLEYQGISFEEESKTESLLDSIVNRIFATTIVIPVTKSDGTSGGTHTVTVSTTTTKKTSTQLTKSQATYAAQYTGKAISELTEIATTGTSTSTRTSTNSDGTVTTVTTYTDEEIAAAKARLSAATTQYDSLTSYIDNLASSVDIDEVIDEVNSDLAKETAENLDTDSEGQCYGNICIPSLVDKSSLNCGWKDAASCQCVCSKYSTSVSAGSSCSCSSSGEPVETKHSDRVILSETGENVWCWNNDTEESGTSPNSDTNNCYSATNNCYYGQGHKTTASGTGLKCYKGQWIQEGMEDYWDGLLAEETAASNENYLDLETDSGYVACKNTTSGLVSYSSGSCPEGSTPVLNTDYLCGHSGADYLYAKTEACDTSDYFFDLGSTYVACLKGTKVDIFEGTNCPEGYTNIIDSADLGDEGGDTVLCYTYGVQVSATQYALTKTTTRQSSGGKQLVSIEENVLASSCTGTNSYSGSLEENLTDLDSITGDGTEGCSFKVKFLVQGSLYVTNNNGTFICRNGFYDKATGSYYEVIPGSTNCNPLNQDRGFADDGTGSYKEYRCLKGSDGVNKWVEVEEEALEIKELYPLYDEITDGTCNIASSGGVCKCTYRETELVCPDGTTYSEGGSNYCTESETHTGSSVKKTIYISDTTTQCPSSFEYEKLFDNMKAFADTTYTINTSDGIVSQLGAGAYIFEADGDQYLVQISNNDSDDKEIYLDANGSGTIDDGDINVSDDFETINVTTVAKAYSYTLKEGFNFISLPFVFYDTDITTASSLLEYLNETYNDAFLSISKYDSGKWTIVGANGGDYDNNDFQLLPGQGYVLKSSTDIYITLYGNEVTYESTSDSAPIALSEGWNLIGLYGSATQTYTAESLLEDITDYQTVDFTAVNVSRWVESKALYEALQREEDTSGNVNVYGLDFPISELKSYFVKVTDGEGNWEPGLE